MRIKKLSPLLANQISAGEVIERPASVVKELLENSVDSGANRIEIEIVDAGCELIRIRDDGVGIFKDDLELAVSSHATSKLQTERDLSSIASLGFRGEALASISAVSQLTLISKEATSSHAWQIEVAGEKMQYPIAPVAHPQGTTVIVRNLFFNTPVRRKFLYSEKTEMLRIENVVKQIALSRFDLAFHFNQKQKTVFKLNSAKDPLTRTKRIAKLFGKTFIDNALNIDYDNTTMRFWGWAGSPEFSRSQSDLQYIYINGRIVRDKLIAHAIRQAYADRLNAGRYPAYLVYLELDPALLDVNVHPSKHEVRFLEARMVHNFVLSCIGKTLNKAGSGYVETPLEYHLPALTPTTQYVAEQRSAIIPHTLGKVITKIQNRYLLIENHQGLVFIDMVVAGQLIVLLRLQKACKQGAIKSRSLLIPQRFPISQKMAALIPTIAAALKEYGISIELLGAEVVIVRQIPTYLDKPNLQRLVANLLDYFEKQKNLTVLDQILSEDLLRLISQVAYCEDPLQLTQQEINELLYELQQIPGIEKQTKLWRQMTVPEIFA